MDVFDAHVVHEPVDREARRVRRVHLGENRARRRGGGGVGILPRGENDDESYGTTTNDDDDESCVIPHVDYLCILS